MLVLILVEIVLVWRCMKKIMTQQTARFYREVRSSGNESLAVEESKEALL
jgi:hypothetical protein